MVVAAGTNYYCSNVWTSERIAIGYFVYLAVVCWLRPLPAGRRVVIAGASAVMIGAVLWTARSAPVVVRQWSPLASILAGYYLSGLLFVSPSPAIESWLMAWDRRLLGDPSTRFARWPKPVLAYLELIYMACFVVIGAGFLILVLAGYAAFADRYWTLVVGSELGSFASMPFVQTRPPWAIERKPVLADRAIHDLAERMVRQFTICANTFPSGHVAGSLAVAAAVGSLMPWTGAALFLLAMTIALATVVGRYHYVVDAIAGAALTALLWAIVVSFGFSP
jgi:membrane-associated phospholipid phosphatase